MKYPALHVYFDETNALCFMKVHGPGEKGRLIVDVLPDEIQACSQAELEGKIGGTVVGLLRLWNEAAFRPAPDGLAPGSEPAPL
jgi:hypothetical protein